MLEECAHARESLGDILQEVLKLGCFGGDEVQVYACCGDEVECEGDEG